MIEKREAKGTLNVFDIDDTLFRSDARVTVRKDGKVVKELSAGEYNSYKLKDGEDFDFSQFRSSEKFRQTAKPIDKMITRAQKAVADQCEQCKTIIITARSDFDDRETFLQTFRDHGFPIDEVYVERAGNLANRYNKNAPSHITKGVILKKYLNTGRFNRVRMWDDHEKNLNILLKIGSQYEGVEIQAFLVDPKTGNTTRYR